MKRAILAVTVLGGSVMPSMAALPQDAQQAAPPAPQAKTADGPHEIVCHPGEPVLGSRLATARVCRTRKEWDQI